jgi:hypothetical protein
MGYGEVGGNQSVHWKMVHENTLKPTRSPKGRGKQAELFADNDERNHDQIRGRDPIAYEDIGRKGGHQGKFRVILRFDSLKEAREAGVGEKVVKQGRFYFLIVDVPARFRYDPEANQPFEVRVRW